MTAQIKLKHSGGNGVIIEAPASNPASDKTITLPSNETGVFATKDSANSLQNVTGINGGQISNRNLIINGAMMIAQRGTSSTTAGYKTVDRFNTGFANVDEAPTFAQVDVTADTDPWNAGFRKAFKVTNGNQTSGAGTGNYILINYKIESRDIANSGWNYTDPNSYITFSYWVKSSVAQNFYVRVISDDAPKQRYAFETGTLTANTWTKITKTIPGNSNLVFNDDNGIGIYFRFYLWRGTNHTDNAVNLNQWESHSSSQNTPDQTSTWYETNDATFEMTGLQLEVGNVATKFEHKSFDEVRKQCSRYFQKARGGVGAAGSSSQVNGVLIYEPMRTNPSLGKLGTTFQFGDMVDQGRSSSNTPTTFRNDGLHGHSSYALTGFSGMTTGEQMRDEGAGGDAAFTLDAEL